jgi:hypothetical protein
MLASCAGDEGGDASEHVTNRDLPAMVLPQGDLGPLARGLVLDQTSGRTDNRKAAEATIDPRDSARGLARTGRIDGYRLGVTNDARVREEDDARVLGVGTEVELFRDEEAASAYLEKQIDDLKRRRGRSQAGVKFAAMETFDVEEVGEEAEGIAAAFANGDSAFFVTLIAFRRGRLIGSVVVALKREREISADVERLAHALDERIERVSAGAIEGTRGSPSRTNERDVPDPERLALAATDFSSLRTSPTHRGYVRAGAFRAYLREYDVRGGRLGRSRVFYLRTMGEVAETVRAAVREQRYFASDNGRASIAGRFLHRLYRGTGFTPGAVKTRPLSLRSREGAAFQIFFDAPNGRIEVVMMRVSRARLAASVAVMGLEQDVYADDVLALRLKVAAPLRDY